MASRAPMLLLLQTLLLTLALTWFMGSVNGSGEEKVGAELAEGVEPASRSSFVRRQLTDSGPGLGRGNFGLSCSALNCGKNTLLTLCCSNIFGLNSCVANSTDILNCGSCGNKCPFGSVCCNGVCANLLTDNKNCGLCGKKCPQNKCFFGICNYNGKY